MSAINTYFDNLTSLLARTLETQQSGMEEAARLLRETEESNAEIARRCGYTAPSTFYRNFRRYYHVSPGEYKENRGGI